MAPRLVTTVFAKRLDAEQAFHDLRHAGFALDHIGVHNRETAEDLAAVLAGLGLPAADIQRAAQTVQSGGIFLTVQADDRHAEAEDILTRHGGTDVRTLAVPSA